MNMSFDSCKSLDTFRKISNPCSSICQRNSWRELQITKPMMELIVREHKIDSTFWDLPSCFYKKNLDLEEVYCSPWISKSSDSSYGESMSRLYTLDLIEIVPVII